MTTVHDRAVLGAHDYDLVVGSMTRVSIPKVVCACAAQWPEDFTRASQAISHIGMLVLASSTKVNLALLADPYFDAARELSEQIGSYEFAQRLERSKFGSEVNVSAELDDLLLSLRRLPPDTAKAVWAGVAFAQWPGHAEDETRLTRWLDVTHLENFAG